MENIFDSLATNKAGEANLTSIITGGRRYLVFLILRYFYRNDFAESWLNFHIFLHALYLDGDLPERHS
ncbi:hypothetical protein GLOIN_2v1545631 [Rhizophagus irregularis DAOM 181602=DAOM 197198]|uniref:Uncharacterized protein n=1 Tax=Rhizophagus irregularis (strain DAOM 181602 / DAOM 197198 / MUCL 43194) TaxID=747089 RepID=A0A2P4QIV4_RHIID|nr:hypothetical protein GLOIN_2v1545631 [Rhizophagus irregularis DAOM 181602=DAOM 197198]POG77575.1 hypothetical protein GLOIN_2v1545631 [Rhizophagus irregularis DAOM 181602=DAOM 197198]|eukprot:XP_025184441.1 hypothetical protein GLOIN_2v1545631 [Rhizophagus irregularis DAOM 181602=DAOM 197198]